MIEGIGGKLEQFESREEWLEARANSIGGSDAAAIVNGKALDVYTDKIGLKENEDLPIFERGRFLEPKAAEMFAEKSGHQLQDFGLHLFRSRETPFFHYSTDRVIPVAEGRRGPGIVEIKTCPFMTQRELDENARDVWLTQPQHGLNVLGVEWCCVVVLAVVSWEVSYVFVERSERFIKALDQNLKEFWDRVQNRTPPTPEDVDSSKVALARLYPEDNGETVKLPEEAIEIVARWEEAKAKAKEWETQEELAKNELKALIGVNSFGALPNGQTFSLLTTKRASYTVKASQYRSLRARKVA